MSFGNTDRKNGWKLRNINFNAYFEIIWLVLLKVLTELQNICKLSFPKLMLNLPHYTSNITNHYQHNLQLILQSLLLHKFENLETGSPPTFRDDLPHYLNSMQTFICNHYVTHSGGQSVLVSWTKKKSWNFSLTLRARKGNLLGTSTWKWQLECRGKMTNFHAKYAKAILNCCSSSFFLQ